MQHSYVTICQSYFIDLIGVEIRWFLLFWSVDTRPPFVPLVPSSLSIFVHDTPPGSCFSFSHTPHWWLSSCAQLPSIPWETVHAPHRSMILRREFVLSRYYYHYCYYYVLVTNKIVCLFCSDSQCILRTCKRHCSEKRERDLYSVSVVVVVVVCAVFVVVVVVSCWSLDNDVHWVLLRHDSLSILELLQLDAVC